MELGGLSIRGRLQSGAVRVFYGEHGAAQHLARGILVLLDELNMVDQRWIVVCVGSDRSTGDALGPLVGEKLSLARPPGVLVFGTLEQPVHATNLGDVLATIRQRFPPVPVLAVDACLGQAENVGYISLRPGPLRPGTGVNKQLPPVGDLHLVGVVNVGGFMEYFVLQNTRLSLVMRMADVISEGLLLAAQSRQAFARADAACTRFPDHAVPD
ncbi:MAG: spore protease YyaC [Limnochordales bacterium]|nr:spore protease YyaC [Limnochordales bacterium]